MALSVSSNAARLSSISTPSGGAPRNESLASQPRIHRRIAPRITERPPFVLALLCDGG